MMSGSMLFPFAYVAVAVFVVVFVFKAWKIARMPVHLRWELAPVPHEGGARGRYGGSYLEEFEWWTKPRKKSYISQGLFMFKEIVFLKAVFEHNRGLWLFSFPFHLKMDLYAFGLGQLIDQILHRRDQP